MSTQNMPITMTLHIIKRGGRNPRRCYLNSIKFYAEIRIIQQKRYCNQEHLSVKAVNTCPSKSTEKLFYVYAVKRKRLDCKYN